MPPTLNRAQVAALYGINHATLGRLLREQIAPLPGVVERAAIWWIDEVEAARPDVERAVARWERRRREYQAA